MAEQSLELSIILPCLNEEGALGSCLEKIKSVLEAGGLKAEVIVVDNGSTDGSCRIAAANHAKLIKEGERGYGATFLKGIAAAGGKYLFLADADGTYDFGEIPRFISELKNGFDFVIGNRFLGRMEKGAMSWLNRHIGNPVLSKMLHLFFKTEIHDVHCGMRAIAKEAVEKLNLKTTGMEFASEMVIKAAKAGLKMKELPIDYHARKGKSKLRPFADGWRHIRFMLLYSPLFLFFVPGTLLFLLGAASMFWLYFGSPEILSIRLHYHPMFASALLVIIGYQLITFALFAKTYAITHLGDKPVFDSLYKYITIEKAAGFGILLGAAGIGIYTAILSKWLNTGFGELQEVKKSIIALTLIVIGIQTVFSSFMLSILGIKER